MSRTDKLEVYAGIADSEGIESFHPYHVLTVRDFNIMFLRCRFNPQRAPLVYRVFLYSKKADIVKKQLESGEYKRALLTIKENARQIQIATDRGNKGPDRIARMWDAIPSYSYKELQEMQENTSRVAPTLLKLDKTYSDKDQMSLL